jgi:hypothetical protein
MRAFEAAMDPCASTQSDEASLLFGPGEAGFGRRRRKLLSVPSGEASARSRVHQQATN